MDDTTSRGFDDLGLVKTGDTLLFCNNYPTGFLLRSFVSSEWCHSGIAVRFLSIDVSEPVVSLTTEGELFILETNTGIYNDEIFNVAHDGVRFARVSDIKARYNKIAVRQLRDQYRTPEFGERTMEFARNFCGREFPKSFVPFLSVWLGIPFGTNKGSPDEPEMFCSEIIVHYYLFCVKQRDNEMVPKYLEQKSDESLRNIAPIEENTISDLFGPDAPRLANLFAPGDYSGEYTGKAPIYLPRETIVYMNYGDLWYIIIQPLLMALVVIVILAYLLPS